MRTMMLIAVTMFSLAGCLDDGATKPARPSTDDTSLTTPEMDDGATQPKFDDGVIEEEPLGVTRCMTNLECQRVDENTEYHYCDVASGVCIRSPWPF